MGVPTNNTFGSGVTTSGPFTFSSSGGSNILTSVSGSINAMPIIANTIDQTNITFSKEVLEYKIEQFRAGKYTYKYMEVYLEFMLMNALLDNLEYLEYKLSLDKELK